MSLINLCSFTGMFLESASFRKPVKCLVLEPEPDPEPFSEHLNTNPDPEPFSEHLNTDPYPEPFSEHQNTDPDPEPFSEHLNTDPVPLLECWYPYKKKHKNTNSIPGSTH